MHGVSRHRYDERHRDKNESGLRQARQPRLRDERACPCEEQPNRQPSLDIGKVERASSIDVENESRKNSGGSDYGYDFNVDDSASRDERSQISDCVCVLLSEPEHDVEQRPEELSENEERPPYSRHEAANEVEGDDAFVVSDERYPLVSDQYNHGDPARDDQEWHPSPGLNPERGVHERSEP